jgi:hypothetical protein
VKVSTLVEVVGFVANEALTPAGKPVADRVTLPVNPPAGVTVMVSVAVLPWVIGRVEAEGVRVKLAPPEPTVMTKFCVLLQELGSTYLLTNVLDPALNGIPSISRWVELNPPGPVQDHVPPDSGWGPRFTVDPVATVAVAVCCHRPPFTCRYGVIGVGVQLLPTTSEIVVEAVRLLEIPLTVML